MVAEINCLVDALRGRPDPDVSRPAQASSKEKGVRGPGRRSARAIKPSPRYIGGQWVDIRGPATCWRVRVAFSFIWSCSVVTIHRVVV
jgi:hypothetical protein